MIEKVIIPIFLFAVVLTTGSLSYEASKQILIEKYKDPVLYSYAAESVVQSQIHTVNRPGFAVWPPAITWRQKAGDCSEKSVMIVDMLKANGIDASVIYGMAYDKNGGEIGLHDRVVAQVNGRTIVLDGSGYYHGFVQYGAGLYPGEYITEALT